MSEKSNPSPYNEPNEQLSRITTPPPHTDTSTSDASAPFAGNLNSQYQSTPHKPRVSTHPSAKYTRASLDRFLGEDLDSHVRRGVPLNNYLRAIFRLDCEKWDKLIEEWKFHETREYQNRLGVYKSVKLEAQRYKLFANWAASIMDAAKKRFPNEMNGVKMNFRPLGHKVIKGAFGVRLPDVFCTDTEKVDDKLNWSDGYAVFEFKRKPTKDTEKPAEEFAEEQVGSGSKRKQTTQAGSSSKKPKISGTGSGEKAGSGLRLGTQKGSATRGVQSTSAVAKGSGSGPKASKGLSNDVPTVPGYNLRVSPVGDAVIGTPEGTTMEEDAKKHPLATDTSPNAEVQLANYPAQMMLALWFREWVVGILVDEDNMTLWYYDRSRGFCTEAVKFKEDGVSFIKIVLALALGSRVEENCAGKNFGFDAFLKRDPKACPTDAQSDEFRYLDFDVTGLKQVMEEDGYGDENSIPDVGLSPKSRPLRSKPTIRIYTVKQIHRQFTLFGRGTRMGSVEVGRVKNGRFTSTSKETGLVLKISYQVATRQPEYEIIAEARKVNPVNTPVLLAWARVERRLPGDDLEDVSERPVEDAYEKRVLVVLLLRRYDHAWDLRGNDFMDVIRQGVVCHRQLFIKARILHRDLSSQNILYYREKSRDGRYRAILNDYDLAVLNENMQGTGASSKHQTGTGPFMARELLEELPRPRPGEAPIQMVHAYVYELESWMYIILFTMLGYTSTPPPGVDLLIHWRSPHWSVVSGEKDGFITKSSPKIVTDEFIAPYHLCSLLFLRKAIHLFGHAEDAANSHIRDPSKLASPPSPVEIWRIRHRYLVDAVTYRTFCEAIEVAEDDIKPYDCDDGLTNNPIPYQAVA